MGTKRKISILIPYKVGENGILVFLQKRAKDAQRLPDYFGFFGGGAEGNENPEETLMREIKEELDFAPEGFRHFKRYEFDRSVKDIYIFSAPEDFEMKITVLEGEYGKWFNENEALNESKLIDEDKIVLRELYEHLKT